MNKTLKISLILTGITVLSVLSYLLFLKKTSKIYILKGAGEDYVPSKDQIPESPQTPALPTPSGGGSFWQVSANPFSTSAEIKAFQTWVIEDKKDPAILGTSGADGQWGSKTSSAYSKYGSDYGKVTNIFNSLLSNLGTAGSNVTQPESGNVRVVFGSSNYVARFYDNKVIVIWEKPSNKVVMKGYWYEGGFKIKSTEGRNNGKTIQSRSVWTNLLDAVKTITPTSSAIGKDIFPKGSTAMVRKEPRVDNSGFDDSRIGIINSPNVIGKVTNFTMGEESPTPYVWYKVDIKTPIALSNATSGWVREDVVKF